MQMIKAWLFRTLGNICYHLNGRLGGLNNGSKLDRLMIWFWSKSYAEEDKRMASHFGIDRKEHPAPIGRGR